MEDEDISMKCIHKTTRSLSSLDTINNAVVQRTHSNPDIANNKVLCKPRYTVEGKKTLSDHHVSEREVVIETYDNNAEQTSHKPMWSTNASISDVLCLGATLMIVIIQLSVLVFYVFKDHENEETES